jgi:photosystem II stability/assembly factor-like uncharacterized protein
VLRAVILGAICVCAVGSATAARTQDVATRATPVPAILVPNSIGFWDARHGLIGSGFLYCEVPSHCAAGAISVTTDGGQTSRVLLRTPGPVSWVSVAAGGLAWAVVDRCTSVRGCRAARLLRSDDWGRSWQRQPHVLIAPSFGARTLGFALGSGPCEPAWCPGTALLGSVDAGRRWHRVQSPCPGQTQGVSPVSSARAWLLCAGEPGAGNQQKAIYETTNGGRTWRRVLAVTIDHATANGVSLFGYALGISFDVDGVGLLWESRGTLYITRDGGRSWKPLITVARPEIDFGRSASVVRGRAFALLDPGNSIFRLVATTQKYDGWHTVRTWRYNPSP